MKTLSSCRRLMLYFVVGPLIYVGIAAFVVHEHWTIESPLLLFMSGGVLLGLTALTVQTLSFLSMMKSVTLDDDFMLVRGLFRTEEIPLSSIKNVFQNFWFPVKHVHPVVVHLETSSRFGTHILFIPKWHQNTIPQGWRRGERVESPVVQELRDAAIKVERAQQKHVVYPRTSGHKC